MGEFWKSFKHRNVAKVATVYAALSWFVLQAQEAILPTIGAPIWVAQTLLFLMLVGFPIACVIAWASDVNSPNKDAYQAGSEIASEDYHSLPKRNVILIGLATIALIALFAFYISPYVFEFSAEETAQATSTYSSTPELPSTLSARLDLNIGATGTSEWGLNTEIAISPNGRYVAFTVNSAGSGEVYVRDLWSTEDARPVASYRWGTDVHGILEFSDDGQWITYFDSGVLHQVRPEGGSTQQVLTTILGRTSGYDLTPDKLIFTGPLDHLWELDLQTNREAIVNGFDQQLDDLVFRWPQLMPDGTTILVSASAAIANTDSEVLLYDSILGESHLAISNAFNARYIPETGHIVFIRDTSLWAVPYDIEAKKALGSETMVLENIQTNGILGSAAYSFSNNGRLIYLEGSDVAVSSANLGLNILTRTGELVETIDISGRFGQLSLSPSGSQLAYTAFENSLSDIWVWNKEQRVNGRRTFDGASSRSVWTPDGNSLLFRIGATNSTSLSETTIFATVPGDGTGQSSEFFRDPSQVVRGGWLQSVSSSDNKLMLFSGSNQPGEGRLWTLDLNESNNIETVLSQLEVSPNTEEVWWARPSTSPDGKWLAYVSNESGSNQIYLRPYPDIERGKWMVSSIDATSPVWSSTSDELFFRTGQDFFSVKLEAVSVDEEEFLNLETPQFLFSQSIVENHLTYPAWVYDSNEDQFLIISAPEDTNGDFSDNVYRDQTTLTVVENWFAELSALASKTVPD